MKRPPIEQIRRLALAAVVVVAVVVAGTYGVRRWRAYQARQAVPTVLPGDVQQQAERFTFSRSEGGRTLFTVQASRTTERAGKTTVLEDVAVIIYGLRGERADEIRTARCEYDVGDTGMIQCPGEVTVRLGARSSPGAPPDADRSIRLRTSAVHFDPAQGTAWTDQPVRFSFPQGSGVALGLRYQSEEPTVRLGQQVVIRVTRGTSAPVEVHGSQLHFFARAQAFELVPPLELRVGDQALVADRIRMELDADFRTRRIEAVGNVRARGGHHGRPATMRAAQVTAEYSSEGLIERLRASGQVEFEARGPDSEERLTCEEALFSFDASHREIERVTATGAARLVSRTPEETRELRGPVLELDLGGAAGNQQLLSARPRGTLVLRRRSGEERTVVADRIELEFEGRQRLRALAASGSVETSETRPEGRVQTTASEGLRARFDAEGKLVEAEQWGRFRYDDGRWRAEAGRALYLAATQTLQLREQPVFWDASSRTSARWIEVADQGAVVQAEGEVRTTQRSSAAEGNLGFGTNEPVQLAAERLRVEQPRGWARYEGQARLWQGDTRLAAATIELFRNPRRLVAEGNVSSLFVEAALGEQSEPSSAGPSRAVRVQAERFTYLEAEHRGVFESRVLARNDFGALAAPRLEVFLAASEGRGVRRLERARALGGVVIERAGRQASSAQAEYRADTQTVVLWGGAPKIVDPERGTTAGERLTLFLADGTICIDSLEGTRTITRRPWAR